MKFLLDENLPLPLLRELRDRGHQADHIIELRLRGIPDERIRRELLRPGVALVTNDAEFTVRPVPPGSCVALSRVPQAFPLKARLALWLMALEELALSESVPPRVAITAEGRVVALDSP